MYFNEFESFKQAQEGAKSFIIEVERVDGTMVSSSAFPADVYEQALADIANVEEMKTMMTVWNRSGVKGSGGTMSFVPYDQIRSINILFGPAK
jgi:hypothetical protein